MFVLDVGCGNSPVGDVNCDLYSKDTEQHRSFDTANTAINSRNVPNFVVCSAEFLPFISACFDVAVSRQVIEHVAKPGLMASELVRVSRDLIIIETVHRRGERLEPRSRQAWFKQHHINKFDFTVFAALAQKLGCYTVKSDVLDKNYVLRFLGLKLLGVPMGIRVVWSKTVRDWYLYSGFKSRESYFASVGLTNIDK
ncbi:class I SAM-dependent methyltransferase [Candidatus Bathyarchaeota archaeon]|nr:class I SAM-dependent methyltransferase [Candidatus Bathyarchaeota archaeon]